MLLAVGSQLGPYEVLAPLGAGGMGEVYRARDRRLERDVAIKVLPEHLSADPVTLARFEREAKVLASLSHPHIVAVFDVGTDRDTAFVVMELLEGETLRERIARAPLPWAAAVDIAIDVAAGLAAAHSKNVIHGDVKPENVVVTSAGLVKILDFGLARFEAKPAADLNRATTLAAMPNVIAGTVHYMSPEQVRGAEADARSDLFSFGCMLHEMLTGSPPFRGASLAELLAAILRDPLPEAPAAPADVPASLYAVIRACLQKQPEDRIQSAREIVVALRAVASGMMMSDASPLPAPARKRRTAIDSIAILPFTGAGSAPGIDYLCDGLAGRIIDTLSQLPALRVMAWSTVRRYRGRAVDPQVVGRELGVRAVVTGGVEHRGETLVFRLEMVDALDGSRLWGKLHECDECDLLELQQSLAAEVTEQLRLKVLQKEKRRLRQRPTESSEAFRLYLLGRFHWNKRSREGLFKSVELFEQSSQLDPRFALAYAGLADAYALLGGFGYVPPHEAYTKAKSEAVRALELDPSLAEAHSSLATVHYRFDWDWSRAETEFQLAIHHNPGYSTAHLWYGVYLAFMGRFDAGLAEIQRALELDPMSLVVNWTRGYVLYYSRRFDDALEQYRRTLAIDPTFARVHIDVGLIHTLQGRFQEGITEIHKAMALMEDSPSLLASLGYAYALAGDRAEAERILGDLEALSKRRAVSPYSIALVHVGLGAHDDAFAWLEKAFAQREDALVSLVVNPRLDPLRSDPRFADLRRRIGLPQ
jgi:TolB-like protein/Tfp pilus assembly protein PilF